MARSLILLGALALVATASMFEPDENADAPLTFFKPQDTTGVYYTIATYSASTCASDSLTEYLTVLNGVCVSTGQPTGGTLGSVPASSSFTVTGTEVQVCADYGSYTCSDPVPTKTCLNVAASCGSLLGVEYIVATPIPTSWTAMISLISYNGSASCGSTGDQAVGPNYVPLNACFQEPIQGVYVYINGTTNQACVYSTSSCSGTAALCVPNAINTCYTYAQNSVFAPQSGSVQFLAAPTPVPPPPLSSSSSTANTGSAVAPAAAVLALLAAVAVALA